VALTRRCQQSKADGSPCAAPPLKERPFCSAHDPAHADEMAEARQLGGLRRRREKVVSGAYELDGLGDPESIRRLLDIVVVDTLGLENSVARSRTLIAAAMAATRLLEVEASGAPPIIIEAGERDVDEGDGD
jgi:hypothetical protein